MTKSQLSQEQGCEVLIVKAQILRAVGLADTAISLLRRKIEFVADSYVRAKLSLELAKCYCENGDLHIARKEFVTAILDLPPGKLSQEANLLLADVSVKLYNYEQAEYILIQLLKQSPEEQIKKRALNLLGQVLQVFQVQLLQVLQAQFLQVLGCVPSRL